MAIATVVVLLALAAIFYFLFREPAKRKFREFKFKRIPKKWRSFLARRVAFYKDLEPAEKKRFQKRVKDFLEHVKITGVDTDVKLEDKLLVAASGIIPTFGFKTWDQYPRLREVLLYPDSFRMGDFEHRSDVGAAAGASRMAGGMVGGGYMSGKLMLSKRALRRGFSSNGPDHTGIHEFVHLLDMADGTTDGVPEYLLENTYLIPWMEMMREEMQAIQKGRSDIDDYALTNRAEFLAVAAEYFFKQPDKFAEKHPKLFALMEEMFEQDMDDDGGIGTIRGQEVLEKVVEHYTDGET